MNLGDAGEASGTVLGEKFALLHYVSLAIRNCGMGLPPAGNAFSENDARKMKSKEMIVISNISLRYSFIGNVSIK